METFNIFLFSKLLIDSLEIVFGISWKVHGVKKVLQRKIYEPSIVSNTTNSGMPMIVPIIDREMKYSSYPN